MNMFEIQTALGLKADGKRGPITTAAILDAADDGRVEILPAPVFINPPAVDGSDIPATGVERLKGVHPVLVSLIQETAARCDVPFTVIEGVRSAARQAQLVAAGASKTQNSRHLTGHAVDLWPLDPATGKALPSDAAFPSGSAAAKAASARLWADLRKIQAVAMQVAKERGILLEWGGSWGWDAPHFQLNRTAYPA